MKFFRYLYAMSSTLLPFDQTRSFYFPEGFGQQENRKPERQSILEVSAKNRPWYTRKKCYVLPKYRVNNSFNAT